MYLHIGNNCSLKKKSIIGIFDLDATAASDITGRFLGAAEKEKKVILASDDLPKSFILTGSPHFRTPGKGNNKKIENSEKIYLSQLSAQTLAQRAESNEIM